MCYADCDLKSWAQDKTNGLQVNVIISDSNKADEYADKLLSFGGDYTEYTVTPQNYSFGLYVYNGSGQMQLMAAGCKVMGDDTDASLYTTNYLLEKLGRLGDGLTTDDGLNA